MLDRHLVAELLNNSFLIISKTIEFYFKKVREHYLLIIKFSAKNILYNFYVKTYHYGEKYVRTKNVDSIINSGYFSVSSIMIKFTEILALFAHLQFLQICTTFLQYGVEAL